MFAEADLNDLPCFGVAHEQETSFGTGCTVFAAPDGASCGVDVRGGGPATRETDLLDPTKMIEKVHAVVLSGGSAFGLEASCGVMEVLSRKKIGFKVGDVAVPIVPSACLFDLLIGERTYPDKGMGARACEAALTAAHAPDGSRDLAQGNYGAGCGCSVGKMGLPERAMKSGFGWSGCKLADMTVVACVAVNALGNVIAEDGSWLAGTLDPQGQICDPLAAAAEAMASSANGQSGADAGDAGCTQNTTLGVVLTNATLTKAECTKISQATHDAYARAIRPVHTQNDGDAVFTMAACSIPPQPMQLDLLSIMATNAMEQAIRNAVLHAESAYGLESASSLHTAQGTR